MQVEIIIICFHHQTQPMNVVFNPFPPRGSPLTSKIV